MPNATIEPDPDEGYFPAEFIALEHWKRANDERGGGLTELAQGTPMSDTPNSRNSMRPKRDTTRALLLVKRFQARIQGAESELAELRHILTDQDARTGRRDPSKRKPKKAARA